MGAKNQAQKSIERITRFYKGWFKSFTTYISLVNRRQYNLSLSNVIMTVRLESNPIIAYPIFTFPFTQLVLSTTRVGEMKNRGRVDRSNLV